MYSVFFKRSIDLFLSCLLIILLFPVMVIVGFLLAIHHKGNPFFIQNRPGKHGKLFRLIKFKTMVFAVNSHGELLSDRERLRGLGKIIRKSSLDELPQLWNVLVGDMSLIGPRPLLEEYLPLYNAEQSRRHLVRPGITGLAQVNGRNSISWEKKFEFDIFYVNNLSLKLDIEIFILTLMKFFRPEGINQKGHTTMPKFKGSR